MFALPYNHRYTWYATKKAFDELPASEQLASGEENVTMLMYYAIAITVSLMVSLTKSAHLPRCADHGL